MSDIVQKKILIVDDHLIFREGLTSLFRFTTDFIVVGGAGTVVEAIHEAHRLKPDIVLMDFSLPDGTGLDATQAILTDLPDCLIIFLTVYETDEKLFAALRLGAKGYMLKNVAGTDLLTSLRALEKEELAISRKMMSRVVNEFSHMSPGSSEHDELRARLTRRELEILGALASGASNMDLAERFFLSENTVKHHIRNVFDKLGIANRKQAGELARQLGLTGKNSRSTRV